MEKPPLPFWETLAKRITADTGQTFDLAGHGEARGGCINRAAVVSARDGRRYFVKLNDVALLAMFAAEAEGLRDLARTQAVRVPQPVCTGSAEGQAFLVLEYLELSGDHKRAQEMLGCQLAAMHRVMHSRFGWRRDNTIGSTPQTNHWNDDWIEFYRERRLRFQFELAAKRGKTRLQALGEQLLERLPAFFATYRPVASLLHGDLWSGNAGATRAGEPVIFDPAVYFGDREADLAMTELFGGFTPRFYRAYRDAWPLDSGYEVRKTLYNLYHVLNHFNLFGGGYGTQAERMMQQLLSELR